MSARRRILAVSFVALLVPGPARTDPNSLRHPLPFLVRGSDGWPVEAWAHAPGDAAAIAPAGAAATAAIVQVPLPAGAVQLDSTYYDLQDLGSMGARIVATADGRVHVTWEDDLCDLDAGGCPPNVNAVQPYPQRGMAYGIRSPAGLWTRLGKVQQPSIGCIPFCVPEHFGGFGTIVILPDGRAAISQALNEDGCDLRGNFYLEDTPGGSTWTAYLTPIESPSNLFPQVVVRPNGSFVVMGEVPRVASGCTHCGNDAIKVSVLAAPGTPFTCPTGWQSGPWTSVVNMSMFKGGFSAFPSLAASSNGRVGIAVTDIGGNAWLIESSTGTFTAGTVTIRNLTGYADATITAPDSTSTQFRPSINCYLAYNDTTPNVVWAETQARKYGSTIFYPDYHSRIRHWSSTEGLSTVKQVQPFEANTYENIYLGLPGPSAGFNHISVDWPQVGFSRDGSETYVVWTRFTDAQIDPTAHRDAPDFYTGVGFGDIVASVKRGAQPWSAPQNLTSTPNTDERYPAIPVRGNVPGRIQLLFQASATNQAGVIQGQDRGVTPVNLVRRVAYLETPLAGSVLAVGDPARPAVAGALRIMPNPAHGRVRFALSEGAGATTVNVYSVNGALVARVPVGAGSETMWDGRDLQSRPLPSGVYLARVEGLGPASKLLFLR
jgi:hypothetical protein